MKNDYLHKEYELCFEHLRFYDSRSSEFVRYLFTLTSSSIVALFALYKFLGGFTESFYTFQALLSGLVFLATVLIFFSMLQNRLYFIYMARQINAIRKHLMEVEAPEFRHNQLYTSIKFPAFKLLSVHSLQISVVVMVSAHFIGLLIHALQLTIMDATPVFFISFIWAGITAIVEFAFGIAYLNISGRKSADVSIHGSV